jgi:PDDEXK-like domain of unknown function (DUF3799)
MTIPPPAWTPTATEYHGDRESWSSTGIRLVLDSPGLALAWMQGRDRGKKETRPMRLGSAVGAMVQGQFEQVCAVADVGARTAKEYQKVLEANPDKLVLTRPEAELVDRIAQEVFHPQTKSAKLARALLMGYPGYSEYAHRWAEDGVQCRCMVDRLVLIQGEPWIVEIKTTSEPAPDRFAWKIRDMGYATQAAFNVRGIARALGVRPRFVWVVIGTQEPHEILVRQISEERLEQGELLVEQGLDRIRELSGTPDRAAWAQPWETAYSGEIPTI